MVNPGKKTEFCCKCQLALMFYLSIHPSIHLSIYLSIYRSIYLSIHLLSCPVLSCPTLSYPILSYPSKIYTIYNYIYIYIYIYLYCVQHLYIWMYIGCLSRIHEVEVLTHLSVVIWVDHHPLQHPLAHPILPNDVNWLFEGVLLQQNVTWKLANRPFLWETMDWISNIWMLC